MQDTHERRQDEIRRLQAEIDRVDALPADLLAELQKAECFRQSRLEEIASAHRDGRSVEQIVALESDRLDQEASSYDFSLNVVGWMQATPFLNEFTRWIRKRCALTSSGGLKVPTAAACYNPSTEEVEIIYNPRFMTRVQDHRSTLGNIDPKGMAINEHELLHLILQHVTSRRREPAGLNNLAADCAINSLIARCDTQSRLPSQVILPGLSRKSCIDNTVPKEVREASEKLKDILAALPQEQCTEWYFQEIKKKSEEQGYTWGKKGMRIPGAPNPSGEGGNDEGWILWPSDSHEGWDDIPEELRDIVDGKIKHALRRACDHADSQPSGWGNIPSALREEIRAACHGRVDWKAVLRNWTGMRQSGGRSRSIRRIDRRVPYGHPGLKRSRAPWIDVYVDQSGSVDDTQLARVFGALDGCARHVSFRVWPFDASVAVNDMFVWKRGTRPSVQRVRGGGTSFDAVVEHVNSPQRRGQCDGVIVCTDGECSQPTSSRVKLAWMITPGHKLMFEPRPEELVINMSEKDAVGDGGW